MHSTCRTGSVISIANDTSRLPPTVSQIRCLTRHTSTHLFNPSKYPTPRRRLTTKGASDQPVAAHYVHRSRRTSTTDLARLTAPPPLYRPAGYGDAAAGRRRLGLLNSASAENSGQRGGGGGGGGVGMDRSAPVESGWRSRMSIQLRRRSDADSACGDHELRLVSLREISETCGF